MYYGRSLPVMGIYAALKGTFATILPMSRPWAVARRVTFWVMENMPYQRLQLRGRLLLLRQSQSRHLPYPSILVKASVLQGLGIL